MKEAYVSFSVVLFGSNFPPHPPSYHIALLTNVGEPELDPDPHVLGPPARIRIH
jgi:hypothetical protein